MENKKVIKDLMKENCVYKLTLIQMIEILEHYQELCKETRLKITFRKLKRFLEERLGLKEEVDLKFFEEFFKNSEIKKEDKL